MWFNYSFRHLGSTKTKADAYADKNPSPFVYDPDFTKPGVDDGHIVSNSGRISWQISGKDKISVYHDNQRKYRDHWGISSTIPPDAAAIQVTPTSFVNVTKWTRTHTNKLLFEGGVGIYNQEYIELYRPNVTNTEAKVWDERPFATRASTTSLTPRTTGRPMPGIAPADHFSVLRTFMGAASYIAGNHSLRVGGRSATPTGGWCRCGVATFNRSRSPTACRHRSSCACRRIATTESSATSASMRRIAGRLGRITLSLGLRFDQFIGESRESTVLPSRFGPGATFGQCDDGTVDPGDLCTGEVQNWKDISPRVGFAMDVFGNGRTALKASYARYVAGQAIAFANQVNPIGALTASDTRVLARSRRQRPAARCCRQHPVRRADQLGVNADVRPPHRADHPVLA